MRDYLIFVEPFSQRKGQILAQDWPIINSKVCFTPAEHVLIEIAGVRPIDGTLLGHVSFLPRQTILEVIKPEFGTASARC